jgi:hypothetical protein
MNETDRELLELAAKAAGIENYTMSGHAVFVETGAKRGASGYYWNPLTDDGSALRLAVLLGLNGYRVSPDEAFDPFDATRRAIVRAAAEIGKGIIQLRPEIDLPEDNYYKTMAEAEEIARSRK